MLNNEELRPWREGSECTIDGQGRSQEVVQQICSATRGNEDLEHLSVFCRGGLVMEQIGPVKRLIKDSTTLRILRVGARGVYEHHNGLQRLVTVLPESQAIEELHISDLVLNDVVAKALSQYFRKTRTLEQLEIYNLREPSSLSYAATCEMMHSLRVNQSLTYFQLSEEDHVYFPGHCILRGFINHRGLETLHLDYGNVDWDATDLRGAGVSSTFDALGSILLTAKKLNKLLLKQCHFPDYVMHPFFESLRSSQVSVLQLNDCSFESPAKFVELFPLCRNVSTLELLTISTFLTDKFSEGELIDAMLPALYSHPSVTELVLHVPALDGHSKLAGKAVAKLLRENKVIGQVKLSRGGAHEDEDIDTDDCFVLSMQKGAVSGSSLKSLDVTGLRLSNDCLGTFAYCEPTTRLEEFRLGNITCEGLRRLLEQNSLESITVEELVLCNSWDRCFYHLRSDVSSCQALRKLAIEELQSEDEDSDDQDERPCLVGLFESLPFNTTLEVLQLPFCWFKTEMEAFVEHLPGMKGLRSVTVCLDIAITDDEELMQNLVAAVKENTSLSDLKIPHSIIDDETMSTLAFWTKHNALDLAIKHGIESDAKNGKNPSLSVASATSRDSSLKAWPLILDHLSRTEVGPSLLHSALLKKPSLVPQTDEKTGSSKRSRPWP